jgi:hypothetical protein
MICMSCSSGFGDCAAAAEVLVVVALGVEPRSADFSKDCPAGPGAWEICGEGFSSPGPQVGIPGCDILMMRPAGSACPYSVFASFDRPVSKG